MIQRSLGVTLALMMVVALSACAKKNETASADNTYTGTLIRSVAVGGKSTGWALGDSGGNVLMQLDVSAVSEQVEALENKRVRVTGQVELRSHTESGQQPVLVANRIEAAR